MASKQVEGIPLVKWTILANNKVGRMGHKKPFLFCKPLATKSLWRLTQNASSLWGKVMSSKYCSDSSIIVWLRNLDKTHKNGLTGSKALV